MAQEYTACSRLTHFGASGGSHFACLSVYNIKFLYFFCNKLIQIRNKIRKSRIFRSAQIKKV